MVDVQKPIALKLVEPKVDCDNPWGDDLLKREEIAGRLTNLIAYQEEPLTVSLHGQWGTGKTFMLRRWQKALEKEGYSAIYFNAWEDDFSRDPLLAIIAQLSDYFKEPKFKELARKAAEFAVPLIKANIPSVLKATTGLTIELGQSKADSKPFLDEYLELKDTKQKLKAQLTKLSKRVADETGHPLVFIIDELDRCRPTFSIELLERVKHIFDVPHTVFVFGLNRDELCKTLSSIYGEINTDVYLRRFFDFEFNLPEVGSQDFATHLMGEFGILDEFRRLIERNNEPFFRIWVLPDLWNALGLSLRDTDYGIRLLALLLRNERVRGLIHPFLPVLSAVLIAMKFKKPEFYRSLAAGNFRASEIMDYIEEEARRDLVDKALSWNMDRVEGFLYYCADETGRQAAIDELHQRLTDPSKTDFRVISRRAQNADRSHIKTILDYGIPLGSKLQIEDNMLGWLASLIDMYQTELRH